MLPVYIHSMCVHTKQRISYWKSAHVSVHCTVLQIKGRIDMFQSGITGSTLYTFIPTAVFFPHKVDIRRAIFLGGEAQAC